MVVLSRSEQMVSTAHFDNISRLYVGWPTRADTWREGGLPAQRTIIDFIHAVVSNTSRVQIVVVVADGASRSDINFEALLLHGQKQRVDTLVIPHDDCWLQDIGPVFVAKKAHNYVAGVCFSFNAWGGECYSEYSRDAAFGRALCTERSFPRFTSKLSLEGGAISSNGEGTVLITRECVHHRGLSDHVVEQEFYELLGATKIIWLPWGAKYDTDTHGHVDNIAVFIAPNRAVLLWESEVHSGKVEKILEDSGIIVHRVDAPPILRRSREEASGVQVGAKARSCGEELCASYTNFVMVEDTVFAPKFGVAHADERAWRQLSDAFKYAGRKVVMVAARELILAGGGLHCISLGEPAVPSEMSSAVG